MRPPPPPHVYLHWVHSGAFLTAMQEPHMFDEQVVGLIGGFGPRYAFLTVFAIGARSP